MDERRPLPRMPLALVAALLLVLAVSGCGDSEPAATDSISDQVQASVCRLRAAAGDADCDGVLNAYDTAPGANDFQTDSDADGISNALDRFDGDDLGDLDGDGWANRADPDPTNSGPTVAELIATSAQQAQAAQQAQLQQQEAARLATESQQLANENAKLQFLNDQMDRELADADGDRISDIYDSQPDMAFSDDDDNDGTVNGRDRLPLNDDYQ